MGIAATFLCTLLIAGPSTHETPPESYPISSVRLTITQVASDRDSSTRELIEIDGDGAVRYRRNVNGKQNLNLYQLDRDNVVSLLQLLYEGRFFSLPPEILTRPELRVSEDGTVTEFWTVTDHDQRVTITVAIGDYSKTVSFTALSAPPRVLTEFSLALSELLKSADEDIP